MIDMFESFRELSDEEFEKLQEKIRKFQQAEREWQDFLSTLPKSNILTISHPEINAYHRWMLRDGYYAFKSEYGTRFARKIARDLIYRNEHFKI